MNRHKVVLFMKGNPSAPKCGFSRQIVGLLRDRGVEFAWYDILSDQAVREGLKKMNDWPSECFTRCPGNPFRLCPRLCLRSEVLSLTYMLPPIFATSIPASDPERGTHRRLGHLQGLARERRVGRDVRIYRVDLVYETGMIDVRWDDI